MLLVLSPKRLNFFGEIVEWTGFAVACWSLPATAYAIFTACNIGPRAISHHRFVLVIPASFAIVMLSTLSTNCLVCSKDSHLVFIYQS